MKSKLKYYQTSTSLRYFNGFFQTNDKYNYVFTVGYQDNFKLAYLYFFFTKKSWAHKCKLKQNQLTNKNKQTKNNKGNGFLRAKTFKGWKLFVCVLILFVRSRILRKKEISKLEIVLVASIYYTTDVDIFWTS